MSDQTRQGLALVGGALAFGVAADVLGRTVPGRLDAALGLTALLLVAGFLVQRGLVQAPAGIAPFGLPLALLTVALIWRDSPTLFALNLLGILLLAALTSPRLRSIGWSRAGVTEYPRGALQVAGAAAAGGVPLLLGEIDWRWLPDGGRLYHARKLALGLFAAAPLALLFGGLLMDADPVFDRLVSQTLVPLDELAGHVSAVVAWGWIAMGTLRLFLRETEPRVSGAGSHGRFGLTEIAVVLAVLDLLFLAFVAVQFRYLFAGTELVQAAAGLSYAEYARQGFFQLVAVTAMSLPVLLAADWSLGRRDPAALRRFRLLASVMVVLLNVMLASALWRMRLYTDEYGLTELRFYTTAFMGWLVMVLGWFVATVLRERRQRFGAGAIAAAFLVLVVLNLVNPDALIARTNLARGAAGRQVDAQYAAALSADALPTIQRLLPSLRFCERVAVAIAVRERWTEEVERGERWTISFAAGERVIRAGFGAEYRSAGPGCTPVRYR